MDPTTFRMMSGSTEFPPAEILSFVSDNYNPSLVVGPSPATFTLTWNVLNAASVTIDQGIGSVASSGSSSIAKTTPGSITYTLTAVDLNSITYTATVTINVACPYCSRRIRYYGQCPTDC